MPGRPKPAQLKLLQGRADGRDSGGRVVPEPPPFERAATLEPPQWLGELAKDEWRRIVPQLAAMKMLKDVDTSTLAAYCETVQTMIESTAYIHKYGVVQYRVSKTADGEETKTPIANPAVAIQRNAAALMRQYAAEFGLTPRAETGLPHGQDKQPEDDNPFG